MSKFVKLALAFFLVFSISAIAMAQSEATTGRITGTVKDSQGGAVPNASVTVSNPSNGFSQTFTTNENGEFNAVQLRPGDYTVEVTGPGFGKSTQTGYHVEVGSALTANIALGVGAVNEEVLVTAASVETTQVQTTTNINDTAISQLPINGRRFQDFVLATPTAQIDPQRGQISLVGQRGINGNVQIDGADYNNPFFGGLRGGERSNQAFTIPQGAVREFQVVASGFNAEFGRSTGGIVNVVTKSGTNDFSGSAFYVIRPQKYAHKNAFSQIAAPTQKQFGGAVGGPLYLPRFGEGGRSSYGGKDKSFFFVAYEQQQLAQQRAVLMNNLRAAGINSGTIASGITEALNFSLGKEGPYSQTNNAKVFLTRLDFNLSQKHQMNLRYNYSVNAALNAVTAGTSLTPTTSSALSNNGTEGDNSNTFVGQLTSFLTPTVVNEFRAQYSKENRPRLANELSPEIRANYGIFGTVNFLPTTESDYRVQFADNVTLIRGSHTMKFGGEYNYSKASQIFAFRQFGSFSFSGLGTDAASVIQILRVLSVGGNGNANANGNVTGTIADPIHRFDDTRVRYGRQVGNGLLTLSSPQYAGFAQDSWRVTPNLTLSFGLRYEAQLMPQPDTSNTALTNAVVGASLPLGPVDPRVIADQTKQWAPRGGFAWDPWKDGKGVIRGYTGIYYAATPILTLAAPLNNFRTPPGDVTLTLPVTCPNGSALPSSINTVYRQFNSIGVNLDNSPLNAQPVLTIGQVQQINANVATACAGTFNSLAGLQVVAGTNSLRNPRSVQFGVGVEREIARGLTVGANFDYVKTSHLNFNRDFDLPTPILRNGDLSLRPFFGIVSSTVIGAQNRPITALGNSGYVQVRDSSGHSLYRAMTVRAQLRRKFGQFDAFYVLSKNLDSDSTERNATFASYDNAFNLAPEYNFGALDRRHVVSMNAVLHAPWGFEFAMNGRYLSAAPIDISISSIVAPAGSGLTAAQYAALVTLQGSTSGDLNQDAGNFNDRPYVAPGVTSLRNSYRNRSLKFADLRVQRNFRFAEKYEIAPSLEIFNVFDFQNITYASTTATNYGNPGINEKTGAALTPSNPTFLALRDSFGNLLLTNTPGAPLQIQFGLRFKF
ncbi:MAG: TonB-dependent receptor [Acidobacteriota bacterium]|nr:TonB-dependent receptor [Acidobacteriota bacterium]